MKLLHRKLCLRRISKYLATNPHSATQKDGTKILHKPVMLQEVLENLYPQKGDVILDMTFGGGGHTRAILERFSECQVLALDRDPYAHSIAQEMKVEFGDRIVPLLGKFSEIGELLHQHNVTSINGTLIDAGCSSMQLDFAERGFSLSRDGPLDMRMDGNSLPTVPSAEDVVNRMSRDDLARILRIYGEEKSSQRIAERIVNYREEQGPITRTKELAQVIASAFHPKAEMARADSLNRRCHIATKSFMAIRIFVNDEMNELYKGLKIIEELVTRGGRLVALTFHSLEDRIVKRVVYGIDINKPFGMSLHQQARLGKLENDSNSKEIKERKWMTLRNKVVVPNFDEIDINARSRSAKLRSVTRL